MTGGMTLVGVLLIGSALRDIFHTVFHPEGSGSSSSALQRAIWRVFRRISKHRPSPFALTGPYAMIASVAVWVSLVAVGWALVIWPRLPGDFLLATGLAPADHGGFLDALYLSPLTVATLGYGDISPRVGWLRAVGPLEAFFGFALVTAAVSWVLSIYPVLGRRRFLAQKVRLLLGTEATTRTDAMALARDAIERLLAALTAHVIAIRGNLEQCPVTYHFHADDARSCVAATLATLVRLADEATKWGNPPALRFHGTRLRHAVEETTGELGRRFLDRPGAPLDDLLQAYDADHLRSTREAEMAPPLVPTPADAHPSRPSSDGAPRREPLGDYDRCRS